MPSHSFHHTARRHATKRLLVIALGVAALAPTHRGEAASLEVAGRSWSIKAAESLVGPGANRFSASPDHLWTDEEGLHLTIKQDGGVWYSTEVILEDSLGYGTYAFHTSTRQDRLDPYAVFGAFTWDTAGDDTRFPEGFRNREIDIEDSRWGNISNPNDTSYTVQPYTDPGATLAFPLPDLSQDASLTRYFRWSPGRVDYLTATGHHDDLDAIPAASIVQEWSFVESVIDGRLVPEPGAENFRFNLWLLTAFDTPFFQDTIQTTINDFFFVPLVEGDYNRDGVVDQLDYASWQSQFGASVTRFEGADGNGSGVIDSSDYTVWRDAWEAVTAGPAVIPEPSTLLLSVVLLLETSRQRARRR